jgi:uncharacterized RDD family membrane protein YckC
MNTEEPQPKSHLERLGRWLLEPILLVLYLVVVFFIVGIPIAIVGALLGASNETIVILAAIATPFAAWVIKDL